MATKKAPAKKAPAKKAAPKKPLTRGAETGSDDDDGRGGIPIVRDAPSK
jgi:hypothetical protein